MKVATLKSKLKASSLFYALLIALLVAVMSTAFITLVFYNKLLLQLDEQQERLALNANSGLQLLLAEKGAEFGPLVYDLFESESDSVFLMKKQWGFYEVACSQAFETTFQGRRQYSKIALLGSTPNEIGRSALYLLDENKPLALCGKTRLEGTVYRPEAGVRVGNVNGQSYSGGQLVYGKQKLSEQQLPKLNETIIYAQLKQFDIKEGLHLANLGDSIAQSFIEPTLTIKDPIIYVDQQSLSGNITLVADSLIYFGKHAQVKNITAYAPYIYFEAGFKGSVQAFAKNEITIGNGCELSYPSTLCLLKMKESPAAPLCIIGDQSIIEGGLIIRDFIKGGKAPILRIDKGANIKGEVYAETKVQLNGRIEGHITCNGFLLRAGSSIYDNHLLDAEIVYPARSEYYLTSSVREGNVDRKVLKWLE